TIYLVSTAANGLGQIARPTLTDGWMNPRTAAAANGSSSAHERQCAMPSRPRVTLRITTPVTVTSTPPIWAWRNGSPNRNTAKPTPNTGPRVAKALVITGPSARLAAKVSSVTAAG